MSVLHACRYVYCMYVYCVCLYRTQRALDSLNWSYEVWDHLHLTVGPLWEQRILSNCWAISLVTVKSILKDSIIFCVCVCTYVQYMWAYVCGYVPIYVHTEARRRCPGFSFITIHHIFVKQGPFLKLTAGWLLPVSAHQCWCDFHANVKRFEYMFSWFYYKHFTESFLQPRLSNSDATAQMFFLEHTLSLFILICFTNLMLALSNKKY